MSRQVTIGLRVIVALATVVALSFAMLVSVATPAQATPLVEFEATGPSTSVGGSGGNAFGLQSCPAGYIAIGARAHDPGSYWAQSYGLVCQKIDLSTGQLTNQGFTATVAGSSPTSTILCPSGQVLVGMKIYAFYDYGYAIITETTPKCQTLSVGTMENPSAPKVSGAITTASGSFGSFNGSYVSDANCPSGQFIIGFAGRSGAALDLFTPYCGRFKALAPTVTSPSAISTATPTTSTAVTVSATMNGEPAPTMSYQWYRCTSPGATASSVPGDCTPISGATASSYTPTAADTGSYLRGAATGTNIYGQVTSVSAASGPVKPNPPTVDLIADSDTGTSTTDNLTADATPTIRANNVLDGAAVTFFATSGGTTHICGPTTAIGTSAECTFPEVIDGTWTITAEQELAGYTSAKSSNLNVIVDTVLPTFIGAPTITPSGGTVVAGTLTATNTSATFTSAITAGQATGGYAEFYIGSTLIGRDTTITSANTSVSLAVGSSAATLQSAIAAGGDVTVKLFDAAGNMIESSATPLAINYDVPTPTVFDKASDQPANTTESTQRFTLTFSEAMSGLTSADFTNAGTSSGCTFTPLSSSGTTIEIEATGCSAGSIKPRLAANSVTDGMNLGPSALAIASTAVNLVTSAPASVSAPVITALAPGAVNRLGSTLTSSAGSWNDRGDSEPATSYQWEFAESSSGPWVAISGGDSATFIPGAEYRGMYLRSTVTRTNVAGSTDRTSNVVGPMLLGAQSVSFTAPVNRGFTTTPFTLNASASSGLDVSYASLTPLVCTVEGAEVTMLAVGTCSITASQSGNDVFEPGTDVTRSFTISKGSQSVSLVPATTTELVSGTTQQLALSGVLGTGAVSYTVTSGGAYCSISGSTLITTGAGSCTVTGTVAGDALYNGATSPAVTFNVKQPQTLTYAQPSDVLLSTGTRVVAPTSSIAGLSPALRSTTPDVCTTSGMTITLIASGTCTTVAEHNGNATTLAATPVTRSFEVVDVPTAPTIDAVSVSGSDELPAGTALVSFSPGTANGSVIQGYRVIATPRSGGSPIVQACESSPCLIDGLISDEEYEFVVETRARALTQNVDVRSTPSSFVTIPRAHNLSISNPGILVVGEPATALAVISEANPQWRPVLVSSTPGICTVSGSTVIGISPGECVLVASHEGGRHNGFAYGWGETSISITVSASAPANATPTGDQPAPVIPGINPPPPPKKVVVKKSSTGGEGATVKVTLPKATDEAPIHFVVLVIKNPASKTVAKIKVAVTPGVEFVDISIPFLADDFTVHALTKNNIGIAGNGLKYPNIKNQKTILGVKKNGKPILFGKKFAAPIFFGPDSPTLDDQAFSKLRDAVEYVKENGGKVFITGFVRNAGGNKKDQLSLANARARNVAKFLSDRGVDCWIRFDGFGAMTPDRIGSEKDRRVELRWSSDEISDYIEEPDQVETASNVLKKSKHMISEPTCTAEQGLAPNKRLGVLGSTAQLTFADGSTVALPCSTMSRAENSQKVQRNQSSRSP